MSANDKKHNNNQPRRKKKRNKSNINKPANKPAANITDPIVESKPYKNAAAQDKKPILHKQEPAPAPESETSLGAESEPGLGAEPGRAQELVPISGQAPVLGAESGQAQELVTISEQAPELVPIIKQAPSLETDAANGFADMQSETQHFDDTNSINNSINISSNSDNTDNSTNNGKSLKNTFTDYLNQQKTSRPLFSSKSSKTLEFTQPPYDADAFAAEYNDSMEHNGGGAVGGFVSIDDEAAHGGYGSYGGDDYENGSGYENGDGYESGDGYGGGYDGAMALYGDNADADNNLAYYGDGYDGAIGGEYGVDYYDGSGDIIDGDYGGDFGGYPDDDFGGEYSGDYENVDGGEPAGKRKEITPRRVILGILKAIYIAIKWVLIYMGRFIVTVCKTSIIIILVVAFGVLGAGVGAIYGYLQNIEPITDIMLEMKIQTSYIYDADGNQIARLTGSGNVNRQLVHYSEISPYLPKALIAIEDKRFESHNGVDPKRIMSAGLKFILGGSDAHGASTITQQLVKNVTGKKDETLERKVQEWYLAMELEKTMEKWKILELYLNVVYFGNGSYGVSSASRTYFGKPVGDLTLAESAFLIGITNSPGLYNPFSESGYKNAIKRQAIILNEMLSQGMISDEEYDEAIEEQLEVIPKAVATAVSSKPNSYFVDYVIEEVKNDLMTEKGMTAEMALAQIYNYGLQIYTTQRPAIQAALDDVFNDPQYFPAINPDAINNDETPQGAMVILDPITARVLAMTGGYGEKLADRTFNRATQARRQPGSSLKPVAVFAPALDQNVITLASVFDDAPAHMDPQDTKRIYPNNSTSDFRGLTTVRNAVRRSVNVVAAKVWVTIPDTSLSYLKKSGIDRDNEKNVSLSLGGLHKGVTPLEMAAAYVPFVNRGMYYEPSTYTKVLDSNGRILLEKTVRQPTIIYSEQTAYLMTSALEDVIKTGTGTAAALFDGTLPAAGKTGTTNDNADRWFVGYTPYYVASTWYGYDNRIKKITLTQEELNNAMIIWKTVMEKIHEGLEPKEFVRPDQIVTANVCAYSGKTPTALCRDDPRGNAIRTEIFAAGTEPHETDLCTVHVIMKTCPTGSEAVGKPVEIGPYCPIESADERIVTRREFPFIPKQGDPYPSDWQYEFSATQVCPYHTEYGISTDVVAEVEEGLEGAEGEEIVEGEDGAADGIEGEANGEGNNGIEGDGIGDRIGEDGDQSAPDRDQGGNSGADADGGQNIEPGGNSTTTETGDGDADGDDAARPTRTPRPGRNIPVTDLIGVENQSQTVPNDQTDP